MPSGVFRQWRPGDAAEGELTADSHEPPVQNGSEGLMFLAIDVASPGCKLLYHEVMKRGIKNTKEWPCALQSPPLFF